MTLAARPGRAGGGCGEWLASGLIEAARCVSWRCGFSWEGAARSWALAALDFTSAAPGPPPRFESMRRVKHLTYWGGRAIGAIEAPIARSGFACAAVRFSGR